MASEKDILKAISGLASKVSKDKTVDKEGMLKDTFRQKTIENLVKEGFTRVQAELIVDKIDIMKKEDDEKKEDPENSFTININIRKGNE
jgi:hypothetical protein